MSDPGERDAAQDLAVGNGPERRRSDDLFRRVAALSPNFIFIYDYDASRDVYINRSLCVALGYDGDEEAKLAPYPFAHLCHPQDIGPAMDWERRWGRASDGDVDVVEFRLRAADGTWRWFRSQCTPFRRDAEGRVRQILGVSEDVTELRRQEEALRRSERLASLAVLASGLAHDFGNLLTPILGRAGLLLERAEADPLTRADAEAIQIAATRASELVEQLLVYAGRRPLERRPIELNALVREIVELHTPVLPEKVRIDLELDPRLPRIAGDAGTLRRVVLNLLTNALDATRERGGRIHLRTAEVEIDQAELLRLDLAERWSAGPAVRLEVVDDGAGMSVDARSRIWEPFFTTKPQGRGLGLAATLGILRLHHAAVAVDSNEGEGARFRLYFPPLLDFD